MLVAIGRSARRRYDSFIWVNRVGPDWESRIHGERFAALRSCDSASTRRLHSLTRVSRGPYHTERRAASGRRNHPESNARLSAVFSSEWRRRQSRSRGMISGFGITVHRNRSQTNRRNPICDCMPLPVHRSHDDGRERLARRGVGSSAKAVAGDRSDTPRRLALDQGRDEKLRAMPPEHAADEWLRPVIPVA